MTDRRVAEDKAEELAREQQEFEKWAFEDSELEDGGECDPDTGCYEDDKMEIAWPRLRREKRDDIRRISKR